MTAAEIIAELMKFPPHLPVRVVICNIARSDELGDYDVLVHPSEGTEADIVRYEGSYILIQGK